jgi:hypothetical protein
VVSITTNSPAAHSEPEGTIIIASTATAPSLGPAAESDRTSIAGTAAVIILNVEARVLGYTKADFSVATFRDALAATLRVLPDSIAVLSVEDQPVRRAGGGGVSITSAVAFPAGKGQDAAAAAARLAPEALTRNLRAGGMTAASVEALVSAISDPMATATTLPVSTPMPAPADSGPNVTMIGPWGGVGC